MKILKEQEKTAQSVKQILSKVSTPHSNARGCMHTRSEFWISIMVLLYPDSFKEQRVLFITNKEWLKMTSFCQVGEFWGRGSCPQSAQEQISASSGPLWALYSEETHSPSLCKLQIVHCKCTTRCLILCKKVLPLTCSGHTPVSLNVLANCTINCICTAPEAIRLGTTGGSQRAALSEDLGVSSSPTHPHCQA